MVERKDKLLLYFFISATFLHSLSNTVVENITVPCGSSYNIRIEEDSSLWISSAWKFERNNGENFILFYYDNDDEEYVPMRYIRLENIFILDYGLHYLSLYQMSLILNNSIITFTSYSQKNMLGEILLSKKFKIIITVFLIENLKSNISEPHMILKTKF
ncbi:hypothetical protein HZS_5518 [Henneguya salminicola]|nr:hypothetical protein HZS_5518 [Henneguya salminicola]